jgi:hypothetical protein
MTYAQATSTHTLSSTSSGSNDGAASPNANAVDPDAEVDDSVTQMQAISGKQTLTKVMARRLSRARTRSKELLSVSPVAVPDPSAGPMLIGVQVEAVTRTRSASRPGTSSGITSSSPTLGDGPGDVPAALPKEGQTEVVPEQHEEEDDDSVPHGTSATVHRPEGTKLRKERSRLSLFGGKGESWVKALTLRFKRRKSRPALVEPQA